MLETLLQQVSPFLQAPRWYVAYSGGLDSHVLLHALTSLSRIHPLPPITAVHVNHQIQSHANAWEEHCSQQATLLGVEFISFRVNIDVAANVEAQAREARYTCFQRLIGEGDCLLLAHHRQDQIETMLYRLFRGSGVKGLSAMQASRVFADGLLLRPFLSIDKAELEQYAIAHHLSYVNDPTNSDTRYDRNYIRRNISPVIAARWPAFGQSVQRSISHLQEAHDLLTELASNDMQQLNVCSGDEPSIALDYLSLLSEARQKNVLRYWLAQFSIELTAAQMQQLLQTVLNAAEDAESGLRVQQRVLRRFRHRLYLTHSVQPFTQRIEWNALSTCVVPGYGLIFLSEPMDRVFVIKPRAGGETIKLADNRPSRKVKKLLQELDVPPWHRDVLPMIYDGNELIAIGVDIVSDAAKVLLQGRYLRRQVV